MTNTPQWIEWNGGECPVDPEALVEVECRDGYEETDNAGKFGQSWNWWEYTPAPYAKTGYGYQHADIVRYRVISQGIEAGTDETPKVAQSEGRKPGSPATENAPQPTDIATNIDHIEKLLAEATPGPWIAAAKPSTVVGWPVVASSGRSIASLNYVHHSAIDPKVPGDDAFNRESAANAALISELRNQAPTLIAEIRQLREGLEQIAGNNWKDQSRARHVARALLSPTKGKMGEGK